MIAHNESINSKNKSDFIMNILIALTIIVFIINILLYFLFPLDNFNNQSTSSLEENKQNVQEIEDIMKELTEFYDLLSMDNLDADSGYVEENSTCYLYKGNIENMKTKIAEIYSQSNLKDSDFRTSISTYQGEKKEEMLYICIPKGCIPGGIDKYEIIDETSTETAKDIRFNSIYVHRLIKEDDKWKFETPKIVCK